MSNRHIFSDDDLEYMSSLNMAAYKTTTQGSRLFIWAASFIMVGAIVWMGFAHIDEITKGDGKVIPSTHLRVVQHLEGGVVESIHVKEGERVKEGALLVRLSQIKSQSALLSNTLKSTELEAKRARLEAEASMREFTAPAQSSPYALLEQEIFNSNKRQLINKISILNEQLNQKTEELEDAKNSRAVLLNSRALMMEEEKIAKEMLKSGVESKVEYLKLQRERNEIEKASSEALGVIERTKHAISEIKAKMLQEKIDYQTRAKEELGKTFAELKISNAEHNPLKDTVARTEIKAPASGVIKQVFITTTGGVIRPGMDILEMIPSEDHLLIETKIKPSDIAFIHPGQKAIVKFSAYDFSIYGGMVGEVVQISSDTIVDQQKQESYYLVKIKTNQHDAKNRRLASVQIIPGMTANVDIVTGDKTVLQYLLKPIIKAWHNSLTEK